MKGLIWCKEKWTGAMKLQSVIADYEHSGIEVETQGHNSAVFKNGDIWKIVPAYESSRGYRANINYVDRAIDYEFYSTVIAKTAICMPFIGVAFYGEGDLHITDNEPKKSYTLEIDEYASRPFKGK